MGYKGIAILIFRIWETFDANAVRQKVKYNVLISFFDINTDRLLEHVTVLFKNYSGKQRSVGEKDCIYIGRRHSDTFKTNSKNIGMCLSPSFLMF